PWWASIVLGTVMLRGGITLPIAMLQQRSAAQLMQLRPMISAWAEAIGRQVGRESQANNWPYERFQREVKRRVGVATNVYMRKIHQVYWRHRCHPAFNIALVAVQMPLFVSMSLMVRRMCGSPVPWMETRFDAPVDPALVAELASGGMAWFTDLTVSDTTLILPTVIGLLHLANVELGSLSGRTKNAPEPTKWQRRLRNALRGVSIASVPIAAQLPAAVCVYWATSATFSLGQNI
ncbi:membrane insertase OXA1/ALB3/YidC, partial [Thamnocephalis sphaerospora]